MITYTILDDNKRTFSVLKPATNFISLFWWKKIGIVRILFPIYFQSISSISRPDTSQILSKLHKKHLKTKKQPKKKKYKKQKRIRPKHLPFSIFNISSEYADIKLTRHPYILKLHPLSRSLQYVHSILLLKWETPQQLFHFLLPTSQWQTGSINNWFMLKINFIRF